MAEVLRWALIVTTPILGVVWSLYFIAAMRVGVPVRVKSGVRVKSVSQVGSVSRSARFK